MSRHHLEEVSGGWGDQISLRIRWNDARLVVNLDRSQSSTAVPPLENSFIDRYSEAFEADEIEECETVSDEILDAVVEVGKDTFDRLAPPPATGTSLSQDLYTLLFPKKYSFSFQTLNGKAEVVCKDDYPTGSPVLLGRTGQPFHLNTDKDCNLPTFSAKDIHVAENLLNAGYIARVTVDGKEMCSKAGDSKGEDAAQRELGCLWKVTKSPHASALRVPKLLGLITMPDNGKIIGFLEEYIPVSENWELSTLGSIDHVSTIDENRRKKWASQVKDTIRLLHQMDITWGDGKASNVLIHRETDDAWVIDFGGGWTEGWVDEDLSGTVAGDEIAVKKIFEYLQV
ncbi:hypothetical protein IL306_015138 [Fusarium sp. DS 682]|nr:hypothetical protein IL306_015138 [Fusarium sp. DS 682]